MKERNDAIYNAYKNHLHQPCNKLYFLNLVYAHHMEIYSFNNLTFGVMHDNGFDNKGLKKES